MGEAHPARSGLVEQSRQHGSFEAVEHVVLIVARDADQQLHVELAAQDRRLLEDGPGRAGQAGKPAPQHLSHTGWYRGGGGYPTFGGQ